MVLSVVQEQLRTDILPVSELLKHSRDMMDQIESLHCALEMDRRLYKTLYDRIEAPLASRRG
jgi:hypothetical protein